MTQISDDGKRELHLDIFEGLDDADSGPTLNTPSTPLSAEMSPGGALAAPPLAAPVADAGGVSGGWHPESQPAAREGRTLLGVAPRLASPAHDSSGLGQDFAGSSAPKALDRHIPPPPPAFGAYGAEPPAAAAQHAAAPSPPASPPSPVGVNTAIGAGATAGLPERSRLPLPSVPGAASGSAPPSQANAATGASDVLESANASSAPGGSAPMALKPPPPRRMLPSLNDAALASARTALGPSAQPASAPAAQVAASAGAEPLSPTSLATQPPLAASNAFGPSGHAPIPPGASTTPKQAPRDVHAPLATAPAEAATPARRVYDPLNGSWVVLPGEPAHQPPASIGAAHTLGSSIPNKVPSAPTPLATSTPWEDEEESTQVYDREAQGKSESVRHPAAVATQIGFGGPNDVGLQAPLTHSAAAPPVQAAPPAQAAPASPAAAPLPHGPVSTGIASARATTETWSSAGRAPAAPRAAESDTPITPAPNPAAAAAALINQVKTVPMTMPGQPSSGAPDGWTAKAQATPPNPTTVSTFPTATPPPALPTPTEAPSSALYHPVWGAPGSGPPPHYADEPMRLLPSLTRSLEATALIPRESLPQSKPWGKIAIFTGIGAVAAAIAFAMFPSTATLHLNVTDAAGTALTKFEATIDGKKVCDKLPCVVNEVHPGVHQISASGPGFISAPPREVTAEAGKEVKLDLALAPDKNWCLTGLKAAANAAQPGVRMVLDGKDIGELPQALHDLPVGEHRVAFVGGDRYASVEKTVVVNANECADLDRINLKVVKGKATIQLATAGARVALVSGYRRRDITQFPANLEFDPNETWRIEARMPGMTDYVEPIAFDDGRAEKTFVVTLAPVTAKAAGGAKALTAPHP